MVDSKWRMHIVCGAVQSCKWRLNVINIVYEKVCVCVNVSQEDKESVQRLSTTLNICKKMQSPEGEQHWLKKVSSDRFYFPLLSHCTDQFMTLTQR